MKVSIVAGLLLFVTTLPVWAADVPAQAATCAACHGDQGQGNTLLGAPRLAGQQAEYLLMQLRHFKAGQRGYDPRDTYGAQMRAVTAGLDDGAAEQLAQYFAAQQVASDTRAQTEDTSKGQALYQGTCAACHGPKGEGFAHLKTPRLNILDAAYVQRQLNHYLQGIRGADAQSDELGIWMRGISLQIGAEAERQAIVAYIGQLQSAAIAPASP